jgi:hypothetical protein
MDPHRWQRVDELFQAAIARGADERREFLSEACAGDPDLRRQIDRLVRAHERSDGFLDTTMIGDALRSLAAADEAFALTSFRPGTEFRGTDRFTVRRALGAGGMGVVYEVYDRVRSEVVALKTLLRARPADIYRLKREFRSLVDVAHPNLVSLYELVVDGADCFFTMELVHGVNLVEYVRGPSATASRRAEQVRHVFRQLVEGIDVLHRNGKLHRDIKPSNIMVTPDGRVVILDFGLAVDLVPDDDVPGESMAGTPAYLAPERRLGMPASEGHDWYGVGVTLYEALTGRVPFEAPLEEMLRRKRETDPCPPADIAPDVPGDLNAICMGLLRRDPAERLTGQEAARLLDGDAAMSGEAHGFSTDADWPFVGRRQQLAALETALQQAGRGAATAVYVHGPSGIGKSALVQRFLDVTVKGEEVVVLRGRCYEYESVPFNALDGIIDSLSRLLGALPRSQAEPLFPPDLAALSRLFPVMLQVDAGASARRREQETMEPVILRQRAFTALRELLSRLAARHLLVVYIDDLHWADADSAVLLEELLRPPNAPPVLLIACLRTEELASKPFLQALFKRTSSNAGTELRLEPMTDDEARTLLACAGAVDAGSEELLQITGDAGGNPFLLRQLSRYLATAPTRRRRLTFAEILDDGVRALPPEGQRFLETLAICSRPIASDIVCDACGITRERQSLLARLRASHFIRSSGSSERVETYHDRIRAALVAQVAPGDARRIHGRMAQALVERGSDDCEALFEHYRGAGDDDHASMQAGLAAAKAQRALAFDRAAWFYREALALRPASPAAAAWREGVAGALANAGQPAAAAESYLRAAADAVHPHRVELEQRAAEQFLIAGDLDRGLDLTRAVLSGIGMRAPRTRRSALAWLLWRRARLRWRGLRFVPRPADAIDSDTLLRIDTCWAAATGLALVDFIEASEFNIRDLQMALDAGDTYRIARAMAIESAARCATPRSRRFGERLSRESKALAQRIGNPHALALSSLADGITAMMTGQFRHASTFAEQAVAILRDQCVGVTWELNSAQNLAVWALLYQGELGEVSRRLHALLAGARSSGNWFVASDLGTRGSHVWLAADEPDEGERVAIESIARWPPDSCHRQHYSAILSRIQIALYRGDAETAWRLLANLESILRQTYLRRVQFMRIEACNLRARSALAMAAANRNSRRFRAVARAEARRISRERMPWSDPIALVLQGGIAFLDGERPLALRYLHDAADRFERADMRLHAAAVRRRIGELQDDAAGRELRRQAEAWMATQQIKNPAGMTRMLVPGFPDLT